MSDPSNPLNFIYQRRSVRRYQERPVERELLTELVRAGAAAPSAVNRRPWGFVIVDDPGVLAACLEVMRFARHGAPAAVVVCGDLSRALPRAAQEYWIQDCSAATQNVLLAAAGLGLGAVWCGVHPIAAQVRGLRQALGLPDHVVPLSFVCVGWPVEVPPPRTQYDPAQVHYNAWDPARAGKPSRFGMLRLAWDFMAPKKKDSS